MKIKLKVVFIVPYFGKMPDYFNLWKISAERNPEFSFYIYTDLPLQTSNQSNVKIKYISFNELQKKLKNKLGQHCKIKDPYKLCDYKPTYGYLFSEDIKEFDFWGFCDIDLIFGNIGGIITQDVLQNYDKIFMHGHFCIMRNTYKMNLLFKEKYPRVLDFDYTSKTNYSCHFDENGTIAYASDFDKEIRYCSPGNFYDVPSKPYQMMYQNSEACAVWENGILTMYWDGGTKFREILYIHLQKRKMKSIPSDVSNRMIIFRDQFIGKTKQSPAEILNIPIESQDQNEFVNRNQKRRRRDLVKKLKSGAIKFRAFRCVYQWQSR